MSNEEFPRDSTNAILPVIAEDGSSELRRRHQRVSWLGSMQFSVAGEEAGEGEGPEQQTYAERAMANGMAFTVTDVPPLGLSIILGVQHYLTMLGATVLIPLLICPEMGASPQQTAQVISTIFFVSGLNTLIQTSIGDRLPIVQGGSFSYLPATYGIIFNPELQAIEDDNERFLTTMQTIQGAIIVVGIIQMAIGYSGLFGKFLKFISPITIACVISAVGLGLYGVAFPGVADCFATGLLMIAMLVFFPLYMSNVKIYGLAVFRLFPVVLSIATTWIFAAILSAAGVWDEDDACSTAGSNDLIASAKWFYFPYPGQWGPPRFESYAIIPMIGSMLASSIESLGDYYACANIAGAPPPTPGIISRGVAGEGIGVVLAGLWGTGNGTTSYSENVGALSITGVGSRAVVQCGAVAMILVSVIAKVSRPS
jgi:nucleobase transporter 1/2